MNKRLQDYIEYQFIEPDTELDELLNYQESKSFQELGDVFYAVKQELEEDE